MWITTRIGFFSIAEKTVDQFGDTLTIRAHTPRDLDRLRNEFLPTLGPSTLGDGEDYLVEAKCSRHDLGLALSELLLAVDYESLRDKVKDQRLDDREPIYSKVFQALFDLRSCKQIIRDCNHENSYGGVVVDHERGILLRKQAGGFDGYVWTFCKGRLRQRKSPIESAIDCVLMLTGYKAEVLERLPGAFDGGYSTTEFFLMRPIGDPQRFDEKRTEEIRWVPFDDAKRLLCETTNKLGALRDQAVLEATQRFLRKRATAVGWKLEEMPVRQASLPFQIRISQGEMARIRRGSIPEEMEDKWYVYFQDSWLNFHRSWSGFCIYRMRLEPDGECYRVVDCWVNREHEQYSNEEPAEDLRSITELLYSRFRIGSDPWKEQS